MSTTVDASPVDPFAHPASFFAAMWSTWRARFRSCWTGWRLASRWRSPYRATTWNCCVPRLDRMRSVYIWRTWPSRSELEYPACAQHEALIKHRHRRRTASAFRICITFARAVSSSPVALWCPRIPGPHPPCRRAVASGGNPDHALGPMTSTKALPVATAPGL